MADLFGKITESGGLLQKIGSKIPGFSGYLERENRRTADKMLRDEIARRFEEQVIRLDDIQRELMGGAGLEYLDDVQTAATRLRTFMDQVKTAPRGYSGFFDAVKVNEAELAKLYEFDNALLEGAAAIASAIDNLQASIGSDGMAAAARNLTQAAADCNTAYGKRRDVIMSTSS